MTRDELSRRLDAAGYDTGEIEALGRRLGVDLIGILAGWAPVIVALERPAPAARRGGFWAKLVESFAILVAFVSVVGLVFVVILTVSYAGGF